MKKCYFYPATNYYAMGFPKKCANCSHPLEANHKYCPNCGQKVNEELSIGVLFNNTISNYFSVDARFFKSFIPLIIKPGFLPRVFVGGKRLTYLHPAQMYLFISVIFFFLFSFVARITVKSFDEAVKIDFKENLDLNKIDSINTAQIKEYTNKNAKAVGFTSDDLDLVDSLSAITKEDKLNDNLVINFSKIDSLVESGATNKDIKNFLGFTGQKSWLSNKLIDQFLKFYRNKSGGSILQAFYDSIPFAMFFLLPIFAFILKILFFKTARYTHHLVFTFYYFAFVFFIFSIELLFNNFIISLPWWLNTLLYFYIYIYLFLGIKNYYKKSWMISFIRTSLVVILFIFPLFILISGLIFNAFLTF